MRLAATVVAQARVSGQAWSNILGSEDRVKKKKNRKVASAAEIYQEPFYLSASQWIRVNNGRSLDAEPAGIKVVLADGGASIRFVYVSCLSAPPEQ